MQETLKFFQAITILSGMIIGVGMFGIPFSFARAGFFLGAAELILLTGLILLYHLLYAEIVLSTSSFHRMPGYVKLYLGKQWAILEGCSSLFGILGSLLAYLILGSLFLHTVLSVFFPGIEKIVSVTIFAAFGALVNMLPLKKEAPLNGILTLFLLVCIVILVVFLLPHVRFENISTAYWENSFLPYGVLLFALSGGVVIPDLVTFLGRTRYRVRRAIVVGTILPACVYGLFAFAVVGSLGNMVTEDTVSGLLPSFGSRIVFLGSIIGLLATFTSLTALAESFEALLRLDYKLSPLLAGLATTVTPLALYFFGFQDFLVVIGAVGAVAIGIDSLLVVAMYHSLRAKTTHKFSAFSYLWKIVISAFVLFGVLYELIRLFLHI